MLYLICKVGENMKENRNKILLGILIIALIVVIILLTFAAFSYADEGDVDNVVTLGTLELTLNQGNVINLSDTYPLTDSEGLATTGYSFTLENTGTADVNYKIYLDNVAIDSPDVKLDDKYLKYSLDKDASKGSASYLTSLGGDGSRILDQGVISKDVSINYVLRVWPTVEIDGDFGGQVWKGKLRITGDQVA